MSTALQQETKSAQAEAMERVMQERGADYNCFPLSCAQERLWFVDRWLSDNRAYNLAGAARLRGRIDRDILERSFQEIIRRHESLRTSFIQAGSGPLQRIHDAVAFELIEKDLRETETGLVSEDRLTREMNEVASTSFVLSVPKLFQATLFLTGDQDHVLVVVMHHIISDGWSIQVLLRELEQFYEAIRQNTEARLPELEIQYADYAVWQKELLDSEKMTAGLKFWREHLAGAPPVLDLPTDFPRELTSTYRGDTIRFSLTDHLTGKIKEMAARERATPYLLLLAAWHALFSKYSGQREIVLGSPVAERPIETEHLIGLFVNLIACRAAVSPDQSFLELLRQVKDTALLTEGYQYVPFEKVIGQSETGRAVSRSPLVQVVFAWQSKVSRAVRLGEATGRIEPLETKTSKFDLTVMMEETDQGIEGRLEYSTDLFKAETVQRMMSRYVGFLESVTAHPELAIGLHPWLSLKEEQELESFNRTFTEYPRASTLAAIFEAVAARNGDAVAVAFEDRQLTYAELNQKANQLAHYLKAQGVQPEVMVGLGAKRSLEMIIAMLGILKAGGVYAPLDPDYPAERLQYLCEDAGIRIILTQESLRERFEFLNTSLICLDRDWPLIARQSSGNLMAPLDSQNLAYLMYTSGSTGVPKGVAVSQRNVIRLVQGSHYARMSPDEVFLQFAPISFDASTFEIWGALLNGAKLAVFSGESSSVDDLARELKRHRVTTLWLTAGLFHLVVEEQVDALGGLRQLLAGGDVLRPAAVRKVLRELPGCELINGYGPTESTTFACCYPVREGVAGSSVPIGGPIANTTVYLLDEEGNRLPVDLAGELYLGGDGLARGYWKRPDLTAERFVPDALSGVAGARLYRTGDRARSLPDGTIEYLGRLDHQVKIRGFRVELREVEAALESLSGVRECAVLAKTDAVGDKQLIAYVLPHSTETEPKQEELQRALKPKLPAYMVPARIVVLAHLPLTANGKLDRNALPEPEAVLADAGEPDLPLSTTEELIAGIWSELLGVPDIHRRSDFFALGGHSLLVSQLALRLRRLFGHDISLRILFEFSVLAEMAAQIEKVVSQSAAVPLPPIMAASEERGSVLSFAQERIWFLHKMLTDRSVYNIAGALRITGPLNAHALQRSFQEIVQRHEVLRTGFIQGQERPVEAVRAAVDFELTRIDLRDPRTGVAERARIMEAMEAESRLPFQLSEPPLCRAKLLQAGMQEYVLIVTMHHIVSDGWSVGILIRELEELYRSHSEGKPSSLPALTVQYADYADWQRTILASPLLAGGLRYWQDQLAGAPPLLALPADGRSATEPSYRGATHKFSVNAATAARIKQVGVKRGLTLNMIYLAVFQALLARYTGQNDVVVGSPVAERPSVECEGLIGLFVNLVALRSRIAAEETFLSLLTKVKETVLQAQIHSFVPFERVVEMAGQDRSMSYMPLVQVVFSWHKGLLKPVRFGEAAGELQEIDTGTTKFHLTLAMHEAESGVEGWLEYSTELFRADTVARFAGHYLQLIDAALARPEERLAVLSYMTPSEQRQIAVWSRGKADVDGGAQTVLDLFTAQVKQQPEAIALEETGTRMSYAELDRRANGVARLLSARGIEQESLVGLCMRRTPEAVVAMLGILKAGAAYVSLDPSSPPERLHYMLNDSGVQVVCTEADLVASCEGAWSTLVLQRDQPVIDAESPLSSPLRISGDNLAYVIYTSGSTGRAKGVEVTHAGLANLCLWHHEAFQFSSLDRATQFASLGFDASVWEIWSCLSAGATLLFVPEELRIAPLPLARWLLDEKVTLSFLPTPMAEQLIPLEWPADTPLRALLTGGDRLRVLPKAPLPFTLINNYGPTECAVVATSGEVKSYGPEQEPPSIGGPIRTASVYLLDRELQPVPVGVTGELYVGGRGVARGYSGRPELTAERFVPDMQGDTPGARLYRTGDLVRFQPDGQLKFIGRSDDQLKLRGYRIELGEISAVLREAAGVQDVAVVVRGGENGTEARLAAYVVLEAGESLETSALQRFALQHLPDYMVPTSFTFLQELPLNASGKVDRKALPEPVREESADESDFTFTATEELVAGVWSHLLGLSEIGPRSNFFEAGGHSLLATQMMAQLSRIFSKDLPLRMAFEYPLLEDLASEINLLQAPQRTAIKPVKRSEQTALSPAQERLWFLEQILPNTGAYNVAGAVRFQGDLDRKALEQSLQTIIHRHETLRTSFVQVNRKPVQQVYEQIHFELKEKDLTQDGSREVDVDDQRITAELEREAAQGFILTQPGLMRAKLFRIAPQESILAITMHHIISDGWSVGVLIGELKELYTSHHQARESSLPDLTLQYADYSAWQRESLQGEATKQSLEYWRKQLAGAPAAAQMPTDFARPAVRSFRGSAIDWRLSQELTTGLKELGRRQGTTLFMTLLAGLQIAMARTTGQQDLVVGSPIANRTMPELERLIGCFINVLVLRADLSETPTVETLLRRTREVCLGAYSHQNVPFEKLVEELDPERDLSRNPFFQIMFVLQNTPGDAFQLPGLEVRTLPLKSKTAKFDLTLAMEEDSEGLRATIEYSLDLFEEQTIVRLSRHFEQILKGMVASPEARIWTLPMLDAGEEELLHTINRTFVEWPVAEATVVESIEKQAASNPGVIALEFEDTTLTYGELNKRANRLAHYLIEQGIDLEQRVVLCLERSLEMVVAILGVLKAGGAYVPVDESYPEERVQYMLADAAAKLVLTQQKVKEQLQGPADGPRWLSLDADWAEIAGKSATNPGVAIAGDNIAYVIYTSGSTGTPKGAMNTHAGLRNRLLWMQQAFELTPQDVVLQKTPFSFDVSVWEFLWPLTQGAKLVLARPGGHRDNDYLVALIRKAGITTLHFVPPMLQAFVNAQDLRLCSTLRRVFASGEALPSELVEKWHKTHPADLHNLYGPTEASIDVSWWPCKETREWGSPIGRPIANISLYVLDKEGNLGPLGVLGDLYIGGVGLARGYWNRADLTADRFVPDNISGLSGARLYKTGDRARYHADGVLEYAGRADEQVKIRGYRIELGEIETVVRRQAGVAEAAVLVRRGERDQRLVAYLVTESAGGLSTAQERDLSGRLQAALKRSLPEYMVPTAWIFLQTLPLSPNGKLDRKMLLSLDLSQHEARQQRLPAQTSTEKTLALIWQQVLGLEEVGTEDNFFDVGGHSLVLAEVNQEIEDRMGLRLQLTELFQHPNIRALAEHIDGELKEKAASGITAAPVAAPQVGTTSEVAIVGMACRFPGAGNVQDFWNNLAAGVESITDFTDDEMRAAGVETQSLINPAYVKRGAVLNDIEWFDARFFNFSAREAEMTDPQHRVFLECAWEAMETAGYNPDLHQGRVGVYAGSFASTYFMQLYSNPQVMKDHDGLSLFFANGNDFLSTRVSYKLNLTGPSMTLQCGCSTSLMTIHTAARALLSGECDMALAGGVAIKTPQKIGYEHQEGGIFSPDGHCRSFDAKAQGTVGGNGSGVVVLKRLEDAVRDRDYIYAVIKGSAANNDGADKVGYTAPGINGQREAVLQAQRLAGVGAETITYVEAHGTGTLLGDPIEVAALTQAFRTQTDAKAYCALGSVKSNVGHLDTAAGVAGVIKTALALQQKMIPPTLHVETPNPKIKIESSPFYLNTSLKPWVVGDTPRRAAVSSFGIGGTNVHIILQEAPNKQPSSTQRPWQLLLLSAKSGTALESATERLGEWIRQNPAAEMADVAHTLQVGRKPFAWRRFLVAQNLHDAAETLNGENESRVCSATVHKARRIVFMFPGQGSQYLEMGKELYREEQVFRAEVDRCAEMLQGLLGFDLRDVLYPSQDKLEWAQAEMQETRTTQPALFVVEYSLAKLWMSWGVSPDSMLGHSVGEYVAACLADVFSLKDALSLVSMRGRLMQRCARGGMVAVVASEEQLQSFLVDGLLDIAAVNGPQACVVAGPVTALAHLEKELAASNIAFRRLAASHAFHSRMMQPIVEEFTAEVRKVTLAPPRIRYLSNVTGNWITDEQATDPDYYGSQIRSAVQFLKGVLRLVEDDDWLTLEVGPGRSATSSVRQTAPKSALPVMFQSFPDPREKRSEQEHVLRVLGDLWLHGAAIDWLAFAAEEERSRIPLPTYPFERQRYWIDGGSPNAQQQGTARVAASRQELKDWFYVPYWKQSHLIPARRSAVGKSNLLMFADGQQFSRKLHIRLQEAGYEVATVRRGAEFSAGTEADYEILGTRQADYDALFAELKREGRFPEKIVHLWNLSPYEDTTEHQIRQQIETSVYGLSSLAQAMQVHHSGEHVKCLVFANGLHEVTGTEQLAPGKAILLGTLKAMARELPGVTWASVDLDLPVSGWSERLVLEHIEAELISDQTDSVVSYRGAKRWVQSFEPVQLEAADSGPADLVHAKGVYLIANGLSGFGWDLAEWLATTKKASLVLTCSSPFPAPVEWEQVLQGDDRDSQVADRIRAFKAWELHGTQVLVCETDLSSREKVLELKRNIHLHLGDVNGVILSPDKAAPVPLALAGTESSREELLRRVQRPLVLGEVFAGEHLDFLLLCALSPSAAGEAGQIMSSAEGAFFDAYAAQRTGGENTLRLSVSWDALEGTSLRTTADAIGHEEVPEVFRRVLSARVGERIVVSVRDLQWVAQTLTAEQTVVATPDRVYGRLDLDKPVNAPTNATEILLTQIWTDILRVSPIGIDENFFELGGDSLIGLRLIALARELGLEVSVEQLFKLPTIQELATVVSAVQSPAESEPQTNQNSLTAHDRAKLASVILAAEDAYGLSPMQEGMLFHTLLTPESSPYFEQMVFRVNGRIQLDHFQAAWHRVMTEYECLRTSFYWTDLDHPVQVVEREAELPFHVSDWTGRSPRDQDAAFEHFLAEDRSKTFDLTKAPLLRLTIFQLNEKELRAVLSYHHLLLDAWSLNLVLRAVMFYYAALCDGNKVSLERNRPYRDYINWLQQQDMEKAETFWRSELEGFYVRSLIASTFPARDTVEAEPYGVVSDMLSSEMTSGLRVFSGRHKVTLNTVMEGAWALLLARVTGLKDVIFGTTASGRPAELKGVEDIAGLFINTLPLRVKLIDGEPVSAWLRRMQQDQQAALNYQFSPLSQVQSWSELKPGSALFDTLFGFENIPQVGVKPAQEEEQVDFEFELIERTGYPLTVLVQPDEQIAVKFSYDRLYFNDDQVRELLNQYQTVLHELMQDGERAVSALPLAGVARSCREQAPLSSFQDRLWNEAQLGEHAVRQKVNVVLHFTGDLNREALVESMDEVVRRHDILRTTFSSSDGVAVQKTAATVKISLELLERKDCPAGEMAMEIRKQVEAGMLRSFDLFHGPLLRATLLSFHEKEHALILVLHALVADSRSGAILGEEIIRLYDAYSQKLANPLPPPGVQYPDFAARELEWLSGKGFQKQTDYWRKQIANMPAWDFPEERSTGNPTAVQRESCDLTPETTHKLKQLMPEPDLFAVLLSTYKLALSHTAGHRNITVLSMEDHNSTEREAMIGPLGTRCALRTAFADNPSFYKLLERVQETVTQARQNRAMPFEKILEDLRPEIRATISNAPAMLLRVPPEQRWELLTLSVHMHAAQDPRFAPRFTLEAEEIQDALRISIAYDAEKFSVATVRAFLHLYQALLTVLTENDHAPELPVQHLLSAAERKAHVLLKQASTVSVGLLAKRRQGLSISTM